MGSNSHGNLQNRKHGNRYASDQENKKIINPFSGLKVKHKYHASNVDEEPAQHKCSKENQLDVPHFQGVIHLMGRFSENGVNTSSNGNSLNLTLFAG